MTANNCPKPPATELQIDPPVHGIKAMTGLGKTTFVLKILPQFLAEKQEGQAIYISVPTHLLADELAEKIRERFPDHPMRILTYRGLTADDPEQVGLKMCRISEDANDLRQGGADIRYLCGTKRDGEDKRQKTGGVLSRWNLLIGIYLLVNPIVRDTSKRKSGLRERGIRFLY